MTPYFFRGSILITVRILSYNEFMGMCYKDFSRIEALYVFKNKSIRDRTSKKENLETASKLSSLPSKSVKGLFSEEALREINGND